MYLYFTILDDFSLALPAVYHELETSSLCTQRFPEVSLEHHLILNKEGAVFILCLEEEQNSSL